MEAGMTDNDAGIAQAIATVTNHAATAKYSHFSDPYDDKCMSPDVRDAWKLLKPDTKVFGFLKILSRLDPSAMPRRNPGEKAGAFLHRVRLAADRGFDVCMQGIRGGIEFEVHTDFAKTISSRLRSGAGDGRAQRHASNVDGQSTYKKRA